MGVARPGYLDCDGQVRWRRISFDEGIHRPGGYVRNEACDHGCQRLSLPPSPSVRPSRGPQPRVIKKRKEKKAARRVLSRFVVRFPCLSATNLSLRARATRRRERLSKEGNGWTTWSQVDGTKCVWEGREEDVVGGKKGARACVHWRLSQREMPRRCQGWRTERKEKTNTYYRM
ncbi:hypothetical protein LY76DRAFT_595728 [Colletotrichum caudatum]|nr:hypothetical protein LY76DRAFT_595728 [Colletotrichum caudatum]